MTDSDTNPPTGPETEPATGILVVEATTDAECAACRAIRHAVFCIEQGIDETLEFDGLDETCRHFLALDGVRPVGTARSRPVGPGTVKLERIAVVATDRRRDVGRRLVEQAVATAIAEGCATATMHAQTYARPFYEKLGFVQEGESFIEAGIPHIRMSRLLDAGAADLSY